MSGLWNLREASRPKREPRSNQTAALANRRKRGSRDDLTISPSESAPVDAAVSEPGCGEVEALIICHRLSTSLERAGRRRDDRRSLLHAGDQVRAGRGGIARPIALHD